ncbi:MAG: DNA cytosine methyltransferase [Oligoflexia bacterium]|nr:DNA cytosine methyltransferase [Oligoflexia bacterium]
MTQFNFVDLFCGTGGLSLGLEMGGLKNVFSNDADINSINTIRANFPDTVAVCEPIEFIDEKKLKEYIGDKKIHLVAGGPPCQGFSTIGKGDPNDKKNSLFQYFVKVVKILQPEFVMFENVTGLVATKNQQVVDSIISSFDQIGYKLHINILESQHYGVPQRRKRTLIVGCKKEYTFNFPKPSFDTYHNNLYIPAKTLGGALLELENYLEENQIKDDLHNPKSKILGKKIDLERIKHIPEGRYIRYQENEEEFLPTHLRLNINWPEIKEGRLRENHYHRLSRNKPSPTINTQNYHYYHPTENRQFTHRELSVLQSFPPNYIFKGRERAIVRQIGNAVPPLMAKAIGQEIYRALLNEKTIFNIKTNSKTKTTSKKTAASLAAPLNDTSSSIIDNVRYGAFNYDNHKSLKSYHKQRKMKATGEIKKIATKSARIKKEKALENFNNLNVN